MIIYKATNITNGKVYIGQTARSLARRKIEHINQARNNSRSCKYFHAALIKYGFENLIDTYNFKTLYDNLPIKDSNGNIESNIDKIYNQCLEIAKNNKIDKIKVDASITAKPFFEKFGFKEVRENLVKRENVELKNFSMERV